MEQLAALRPRLDRLVAVIGTVATPPDSPLRRLETTLVNVRAAVDMTVDTIADNFPYQHALLPGVHRPGNHQRVRPSVQAAADGYERVRRPNRAGVIRRYVEPILDIALLEWVSQYAVGACTTPDSAVSY